MKKLLQKTVLLSLACMLVLGFSSCKPESIEETNDDAVIKEILANYTNNTVIKTYKLLADKSLELLAACEALQENKTDANIQAAATKWIEARKYWEMTEAFLFGPAEYYSLDPRIDSWPLDKNQLDQELARDMTNVDAGYVRDHYGVNLIGFHAVEYVLFRDGDARPVNTVSNAEIIYLVAVAGVLCEDCIRLEAGWSDNISAEKKQILEDAELEPSANFGYEMRNAGSAGSRFRSPQQALRELVGGCIDIADEVGNSKIADPFYSKNVLNVESWYSWNSLTDFLDNIRSIENAYMGGMEGSRGGKSLHDYVAEKDVDLDSRIRAGIQNTMTKINAIPAPFRNQLDNPSSAPAIEAAMYACNDLVELFELIDNHIR